jgi:prephenate dehydrogenase/signal transduction histidine kinase
MLAQKIGIVGLGLMGGSLARALSGRVEVLVGVDQDETTRRLAQQSGLFTQVTAAVAQIEGDVDLLILATPVRVILQLVAQLPTLRPNGCMVLDLGSTKAAISQAMAVLPPSFEAIGGHPMCGKETAGFAAAEATLYRDQTFVLCPNERTTPAASEVAQQIVALIEAQPLWLDPHEHDQIVAAVSHLPYLTAAALMAQAAAHNDERLWLVSASGFRDTTRLAGSDPRMMLDILVTNKTAVLDQLNQYQQQLTSLQQVLQSGDERALAHRLAHTQQQHAAYRRQKSLFGSQADGPRALDPAEKLFQELINITSIAYHTDNDLALVFQAVTNWLVKVLRLDQSCIALLDETGEMLYIAAKQGEAKRPFTANQYVPINQSNPVAQLIASRAPLILTDLTTPKAKSIGLTDFYRPGTRTIMLVPLVAGADAIGLVYCASSQRATFDQSEMKLAQTVANLTVTRIEQARLFESERQRRLEAETLQNAAASLTAIDQDQILNNILYQLERVVQLDSASVFLYQAEGLRLVACRHFEPIADYGQHVSNHNVLFNLMRETRQPMMIKDVYEDPRFLMLPGVEYIRSWMGVPLLSQDEVIGFLGVDNKQINAYKQHHMHIAQAFANQAAAAIVNSRLFAQVQAQANALRQEVDERQQLEQQIQQSLQRRTEQVAISTEVAQEIAAAPALRVLFRQVVHLVKNRFNYYHAQVYTLGGDYLVLQEGSGEPGQLMKQTGHRISLHSEKGLVAKAAITGRPVLVSDVSQAKNWLPNQFLPDTRSEIAVPILLGDEVLGVLDVQSNQVAGINQEDEILLLGLCGQIAVAINNRRLEDQRLKAERSLKAYTVELERSNKELEEFAYVASHDLQEPLRKIQAFGSRLRQRYDKTLDDRGLDYLNRMESAAARMQRLINDLLTFSRVTTRAQPFVEVDLGAVVQEVLLDLELNIGEVNGRIHTAHLPTIEAEPTQMNQLLRNLISNSLKFHRQGIPPVIHITSEHLPEPPPELAKVAVAGTAYCRLRVTDNGIGFEQKYADRIFTMFQRLHPRTKYEGTGVGLALCRKIVERHQGTITVTSSVDRGSTFIVTLPVRQS